MSCHETVEFNRKSLCDEEGIPRSSHFRQAGILNRKSYCVSGDNDQNTSLYQIWDLIEEYTSRRLSYASDSLNGF